MPMKKLMCIVVCVAAFMSLTAEFCYADPEPLFHVVISNVEEVSGGNSRIIYNPVNYRKGVSDKESFAYQKYKYDQAHPSYKGILPLGTTLQPQGSGVRKPAAKVPTEKTGLLNAKNPINVISYSDKILFGFEQEEHRMLSYSAVRILDGKGKVLASLKKDDDVAEIKAPSKAGKYYVELSRNDNGAREYFYILLNIRATDAKAAYSAKIAKQEADSANESRKQFDNYMSAEQAYMKNRGITNRENLTEDDMFNIAEEMRVQQNGNDDGAAVADELSALPPEMRAVLEPYMKKHGISRLKDLTMRDWKALEPELNKAQEAQKKRK